MVFGDYLTGLLGEAEISLVHGEAVDVADGAVLLADGRRLAADFMVLAPGNFPPATPRGLDVAALGEIWVDDPWSGALEGLDRPRPGPQPTGSNPNMVAGPALELLINIPLLFIGLYLTWLVFIKPILMLMTAILETVAWVFRA